MSKANLATVAAIVCFILAAITWVLQPETKVEASPSPAVTAAPTPPPVVLPAQKGCSGPPSGVSLSKTHTYDLYDDSDTEIESNLTITWEMAWNFSGQDWCNKTTAEREAAWVVALKGSNIEFDDDWDKLTFVAQNWSGKKDLGSTTKSPSDDGWLGAHVYVIADDDEDDDLYDIYNNPEDCVIHIVLCMDDGTSYKSYVLVPDGEGTPGTIDFSSTTSGVECCNICSVFVLDDCHNEICCEGWVLGTTCIKIETVFGGPYNFGTVKICIRTNDATNDNPAGCSIPCTDEDNAFSCYEYYIAVGPQYHDPRDGNWKRNGGQTIFNQSFLYVEFASGGPYESRCHAVSHLEFVSNGNGSLPRTGAPSTTGALGSCEASLALNASTAYDCDICGDEDVEGCACP